MSTLTVDEIDDLLYLTRVNEPVELQQTILDLAQKHNCSPDQVILAGVDPDSQNTVIHYASANGFLDLVKSFMQQLGVTGTNGAVAASPNQSSNAGIVNKPNREGNTALHWAAYNGHLDIIKFLVTSGGDMWIKNSAGQLAMFEAERAGHSEVVQYLLEIGGTRIERGGIEAQATPDDVADLDTDVVEAGASGSAGEQNGVPSANSTGRPLPP